MLTGIHWLGHASFRLEDGVVVYLDPWKLKQAVPADVILITHAHHDHLSAEDIAKITKPDTTIVAPASCADKLTGDVRIVVPGHTLQIGTLHIEAVPAYNTNKPNHPKAAGNVGYIVELGGQRIYHAGDTDLIPEMANIRCDVALLPVGGTYTMDAAEAAQAVKLIQPSIVVPMHWGTIVGAERDAQKFARLVGTAAQVRQLRPE